MKRTIVFLLSIFMLSLVTGKAQLFVGGNLSFSSQGGSYEVGSTSTDKNKTTSFGFYPKAGYFLNDQFAVGAQLVLALSSSKTPGTPEVINSSNTIGLTPFVRYYVLQMDKFSIFGQGYLGLSLRSQKTKNGGTTTKGPKTTTISLGVYPGVAYDISDNLSLEIQINALNLGYSLRTVKDDNADPTTKDVTSSFSFGAGLDNIVNTGSISVGAIYRF
jgi:hypothetical protein